MPAELKMGLYANLAKMSASGAESFSEGTEKADKVEEAAKLGESGAGENTINHSTVVLGSSVSEISCAPQSKHLQCTSISEHTNPMLFSCMLKVLLRRKQKPRRSLGV